VRDGVVAQVVPAARTHGCAFEDRLPTVRTFASRPRAARTHAAHEPGAVLRAVAGAVLAGFRALAVTPTEVGLAAHAGAGRDGHGTGLQVAFSRAGLQQVDA